MINELYNTAILSLASGIPHIGSLAQPQGTSTKTAKLCGSSIQVQLCLDEDGYVTEFAQIVKACALGQAAAAILGRHVLGASAVELSQAREALWAMLQDDKTAPTGRFHELEILAGVAPFRQRHTSTCLAFDAAVDAAAQAMQVS